MSAVLFTVTPKGTRQHVGYLWNLPSEPLVGAIIKYNQTPWEVVEVNKETSPFLKIQVK